MKYCTDLEQSKELSNILQSYTADMYYDSLGEAVKGEYDKLSEDFPVTPCWSLVALMEELPDEIEYEDITTNLYVIKENLQYVVFYKYEMIDSVILESDYYDDLVDACYDMIKKLKENDLI